MLLIHGRDLHVQHGNRHDPPHDHYGHRRVHRHGRHDLPPQRARDHKNALLPPTPGRDQSVLRSRNFPYWVSPIPKQHRTGHQWRNALDAPPDWFRSRHGLQS